MNPMGDSGGRSRGNRDGQGARRRNTQRERANIDPPWDRPIPAPVRFASWIVILILAFALVSVLAWGLYKR